MTWIFIIPFNFQDWELLVLYKLQWELTAITSLDYLDHAIPRLGAEATLAEDDLRELRRRAETILVLCGECNFSLLSHIIHTECVSISEHELGVIII